jgi:hypothetical protein
VVRPDLRIAGETPAPREVGTILRHDIITSAAADD